MQCNHASAKTRLDKSLLETLESRSERPQGKAHCAPDSHNINPIRSHPGAAECCLASAPPAIQTLPCVESRSAHARGLRPISLAIERTSIELDSSFMIASRISVYAATDLIQARLTNWKYICQTLGFPITNRPGGISWSNPAPPRIFLSRSMKNISGTATGCPPIKSFQPF